MVTWKKHRSFEAFTVGEVFPLEDCVITAAERSLFAQRYEGRPLPASDEPVSFWHIVTAVWAQWVRTQTDDGTMVAGMSVDQGNWFRPVAINDVLGGTVTISRKRVFSGGDAGSVSFLLHVFKKTPAGDLPVCTVEITGKMGLCHPLPRKKRPAPPLLTFPERAKLSLIPARRNQLDEPVGSLWKAPPICLSTEDIVAFGKAYDNRPMHVDIAAASAGPFGGLFSSGLHSMAALMGVGLRLFDADAFTGPLRLRQAQWLAPCRPNVAYQPSVVLIQKGTAEMPDSSLLDFQLQADGATPILRCLLEVGEQA